jgi:hypothetical protein
MQKDRMMTAYLLQDRNVPKRLLISAISLTPGKLFPVRQPMSILLYFVKVSLTDVTVLTGFSETCYNRLTY